MENFKNELQELKQLVLLGAKNVLSMNDVSLLCGVSKGTIYNLVSKKKIPYYKSEGGKLTYFKKEEIENWLCAKRVPTAEETERKAINYCLTNNRVKNGKSK